VRSSIFFSLLFVVGCSSTNVIGSDAGTGSPPVTSDAGATSDAGVTSDAGATSASLSCLGVLTCVGNCPEADNDVCVQACLAQTRHASQPVTTALKTCIEMNRCADAACLQGPCGTHLSACLADDASDVQGRPPSGPAPQGSVPAELVGVWGQSGLSSQTSYQFESNGHTTQVFNSGTSYGCESGVAITSSGVTTVSGSLLVYHRQEGNQVTKSCGTSKGQALGPADITYRYAITTEDGAPILSLSLVNDDGTELEPLRLHH